MANEPKLDKHKYRLASLLGDINAVALAATCQAYALQYLLSIQSLYDLTRLINETDSLIRLIHSIESNESRN